MADIAKYNLLGDMPDDELNYIPDPSNRAIEYFLDETEYVVIRGSYDNNYLCWISRTKIDDIEANNAIIQGIARGQADKVISKFSDYEHTGVSLKMLYSMYSREFSIAKGPELTAGIIKNDHDNIMKKCEEFAAVSDNMEYLSTAKDILYARTDNPIDDYWNAYWLIKELKEKDFLYCSPDDKIRADYRLLRHYCAELYGGYTSRVR